jgi:sulfite dehydrogenase
MGKKVSRREFIRAGGMVAAMTAFGGLPLELFAAQQRMARFPEKTDMILLTSRPPQLEMPPSFFNDLVTPNEALFVRWHLSQIPLEVDLDTWRLKVAGNVAKELSLSMEDLQNKFEKVSCTAVIECSGNGRSFFDPRVAGGQWRNGAMGNATWTGVRLRELLEKAGIKKDSLEVAFDGLDGPPLPTIADFIKSIPADTALSDDVIVAYEVNGAPLPMLNGFPVRLVVPGWFATYWVKSLSSITVLNKPEEGFWMNPAYRIPDNRCACVPPGTKPSRTIPINRMNTRSLIVEPVPGSLFKTGKAVEIKGLALSGGYGVRDVTVSVNGGQTWHEAMLGKDLGPYSWRQWSYSWMPGTPGKYTVMARATDRIGGSQPFESLWNPSGYMWNKIETVDVTVV